MSWHTSLTNYRAFSLRCPAFEARSAGLSHLRTRSTRDPMRIGLPSAGAAFCGRRRAGKALAIRGPRRHPECGFPYAVMETVTLTPSPAQLRARLPELMPRDQRRLGRRVENAAALRDAGAREQALGQVVAELEAAERVLARYSKGTQTRKTLSGKTATTATQAAAPARQSAHRRTTIAKPAGVRRSSPSLNDQVLALASGKTQQEITTACKGARPNHVGSAISRHKRAGHIEERDGKLYAT